MANQVVGKGPEGYEWRLAVCFFFGHGVRYENQSIWKRSCKTSRRMTIQECESISMKITGYGLSSTEGV
jgi:hypothetical protein